MSDTIAAPAAGPRTAQVERGNILLVIAHPDDEVFVSGTLCLLADAGFSVHPICLSDGEAGGAGAMQVGPSESVASLRRRELTRSASVLGMEQPLFLHQPDVADPEAGSAIWDKAAVVSALIDAISRYRPEMILSHGPRGGYGHAAHRLTFQCVMDAVREAQFEGSVFSFCGQVKGAFFSWHFDEPATVRLDVAAFVGRRIAALGCHQTQQDYFLQPYFPRTLRKGLSALFGYAFSFTAAGRKRVPIAHPQRFFERFPVEGLVLQHKPAHGGKHLFLRHFAQDSRVRTDPDLEQGVPGGVPRGDRGPQRQYQRAAFERRR